MKVINRAKEILAGIEEEHMPVVKSPEPIMQMGFADMEKESLIKELASIDVMNMTPMESLNKLNEMVSNAKLI